MRIKVGVVSTSFTGNRFQIMERYVKSEKLDMVCFPEGYFGITDEQLRHIELFPSQEVMQKVSRLSKDYGVHIVTGFLELSRTRPKKRYRNKALLFSPEKGLVGTYIKTTPTPGEIKQGIIAGNQIKVFKTRIGNIAMLICFEVWFPELARIATLRGADIICYPSGGDISRMMDRWVTLWKVRAIENNVYVLGCLNAGHVAASMVCGPEGILASSRSKGMITAILDMQRLKEIRRGKVETETQFLPALLRRRSRFLKEVGRKLRYD
jgi:predicted amidohydrolase